jgi:hypothetical protein
MFQLQMNVFVTQMKSFERMTNVLPYGRILNYGTTRFKKCKQLFEY